MFLFDVSAARRSSTVVFNLGGCFFGGAESKPPGRDSGPAMRHQEEHGHAAGEREPELETWPPGDRSQNTVPWAQQTGTHINIQLKENFLPCFDEGKHPHFGCPKPAAKISLEPSEQRYMGGVGVWKSSPHKNN